MDELIKLLVEFVEPLLANEELDGKLVNWLVEDWEDVVAAHASIRLLGLFICSFPSKPFSEKGALLK